jgi:hypothetical protein
MTRRPTYTNVVGPTLEMLIFNEQKRKRARKTMRTSAYLSSFTRGAIDIEGVGTNTVSLLITGQDGYIRLMNSFSQ